MPALATTAIFTFIWTWNDFFSQLIYLTDPEIYTVPVALRAFVDSTANTSWGSLFAMSIVSLLPDLPGSSSSARSTWSRAWPRPGIK